MPHVPSDFIDVLVGLMLLGVQGCIFIGFIMVACFSIREFRVTWRGGLLFGGLAALVALPSSIIALIYLDLGRLFEAQTPPGQAPAMPAEMYPIIKVLGGVFGLVIVAMGVGLRGVYYHVAANEWARIRGNRKEGLLGPRQSRVLGLLVGMAVGLLCLKATVVAFEYWQVGDSEEVDRYERLFPGLAESSRWIQGAAFLSLASAAALIEEMVFRGGILGFFLRITGNKTVWAWCIIAGVAFLWAILHIPNTNKPAAKVLQIFLMGLACGGLMRRWGLGSAVAAHLALNVVSVLSSVLAFDE
jgi:membrane protease YdiL (CAAX protease family)